MNHFLFKLYNGDEIIGRLKSEDDGKYCVEDIMQCKVRYSAAGAMMLMHHWMPFAEEKIINIEKNKVVAISKPTNKIIEYYEENVDKYNEYENSDSDEGDNLDDVMEAMLEKSISNTSIH